HDGVALVALAQQVLGKVEPSIRKELGARHLVAVDEHALAAGFRNHAAEIPEREPELLAMLDGPAPELGEILDRALPARPRLRHEARQVRGSDLLGARLPERLGHRRILRRRWRRRTDESTGVSRNLGGVRLKRGALEGAEAAGRVLAGAVED